MTEPTADEPTATDQSDGAARRRRSSSLTEEALKPVDVDKIVGLHEEEPPTYRVLVPADTERNMLVVVPQPPQPLRDA